MTDDWARLGAALKAAGRAKGFKQMDVAQAIGVGRGAIRNIEIGDVSKITPTMRQYARLVGWAENALETVLAGGEPTLAQPAEEVPAAAPSKGATDDLSLAVRHALREGELLDERVIEVPTAGGRLTATIVVRGEPGASPGELHRQLLEWRERKDSLRGLETDEPSREDK